MLEAGFLTGIELRQIGDQFPFVIILILRFRKSDQRIEHLDAHLVCERKGEKILQPFDREAVVLLFFRLLRQIDELNRFLDVGELRLEHRFRFAFDVNLDRSDALSYHDDFVDHGIDQIREHSVVFRCGIDRRNRELVRAPCHRIEDLVRLFVTMELVERQPAI